MDTIPASRYLICMNMLAFDRSARWKDQDGNLHVKVTNISKATVNPYYGREIPGYQELGLQPERIYQMLRHEAELARGAATFNNLRLLSKHIAVSAADPQEEFVAGSTGTDARFEAPYLVNSLVIWRQEDIAAVEAKDKCQLSCAYYYTPDMTSGVYEGLNYDGVMRDIRGNHVALVPAGRAGPDVMVADSKEQRMPTLASRKALIIKGALASYLTPKLLPGTALALDAALGSVNRLNWKTEKEKVLAIVTSLATPVLAKDAKLDDLKRALDCMDDMEDGEAEDDELDAEDEDDMDDEEKKAKDKAARDKKAAKDMKAKDKKAGMDAEEDDEDDDEDEDEDGMDEKKKAKDKKAKDAKAMDAAIDAAIKASEAKSRAATEAREIVRPIIGTVSLALDSAESIYRLALAGKVDISGVHPSAFKALVVNLPRPGQARLAMDSGASASLETKFPMLARIGAA